jgi:hypothetical protein
LINPREIDFLAFFRYSKKNLVNFGLRNVDGEDYYLDENNNNNNNNNKWKNEYLWDTGWGNKYGFGRLPEPNFEELWTLLTKSDIEKKQTLCSSTSYSQLPF